MILLGTGSAYLSLLRTSFLIWRSMYRDRRLYRERIRRGIRYDNTPERRFLTSFSSLPRQTMKSSMYFVVTDCELVRVLGGVCFNIQKGSQVFVELVWTLLRRNEPEELNTTLTETMPISCRWSDIQHRHQRHDKRQRCVIHRSLYRSRRAELSSMDCQFVFSRPIHEHRTSSAGQLYLPWRSCGCTWHARGNRPHFQTEYLGRWHSILWLLLIFSFELPLTPANDRLKHSWMIFSADTLSHPWKRRCSFACW